MNDIYGRNRTLLADRLGWPVGVLETCLDLEDRFPGWCVGWLGECTAKGLERPAGFRATYDDEHCLELFTADASVLAERMAEGVPPHSYRMGGCAWCYDHGGSHARVWL